MDLAIHFESTESELNLVALHARYWELLFIHVSLSTVSAVAAVLKMIPRYLNACMAVLIFSWYFLTDLIYRKSSLSLSRHYACFETVVKDTCKGNRRMWFRTNLYSRLFIRTSVTNSGKYLISPVFSQK